MSEASTPGRDRVHVWDHFPLWDWLFVAAVAVPTVVALLRVDVPLASRLVTVAIAGGLSAVFALVRGRSSQLREASWPYLAYFAVAIPATMLLMQREPTYFLLFFGLYPQAFLYLGRWWPLGIVPIAITPTLAGDGVHGLLQASNIAGLLGNLALAFVLGAFIDQIATQSERRQEALDELARTRAELAQSERMAGILSERQRLAREIHDTLAQGFTSIVMQLEAAEQALGEASPTTQRHIDAARRTARRSLAEVRRSVDALRPTPLDGASLVEALQGVAAEDGGGSATVTVTTTGDVAVLPPEVEVALVRTAQEALANVRRHAAASRVAVTLSYMDDVVSLDVRDDGRGFDPATRGPGSRGGPGQQPDGGFGLVAMRERLEALGGSLTVESAPGAGTTIAVCIPLATAPGAGGGAGVAAQAAAVRPVEASS